MHVDDNISSLKKGIIVVGKNSYIGNYFVQNSPKFGNVVLLPVSKADCDFLDQAAVLRFFKGLEDKSWTLIFLATVNKYLANSFRSFMDNVEMVNNLREGCRFARIESLMYFSSVDVYGTSPQLPITEQTRMKPDSWYGLAKYVCEWILTASGQVNFPVTILRIPGVYGKATNDRSVIGQMVSQLRRDGFIRISADGHVLRDYVYVRDLCQLIWSLIPMQHGGVLNIATGCSHTIVEISKSVCRVLNNYSELFYDTGDESRNFDLSFDTTKLIRVLPGFHFSNLAVGLQSYL